MKRSNPNSKNKKNKLELIRYVCEELSQRQTQGSICRIFGYINQIYESHIKMLDNNDKVNSSPSAYEILYQENIKLKQKYELEKDKCSRIEKEWRKEIDKLSKNHSMIVKELNEKIDSLKQDKNKNKEKAKVKQTTDDDESDIFEGLSESKKEKIMAEVAELYEANIALQIENNVLKK